MPGHAAIEGVASAAAAFIGPAHRGPLGRPLLIRSAVEFKREFGGSEDLFRGDQRSPNFLWLGAKAFFAQGGRRLYIQRVAAARAGVRPRAEDYRGHRAGGDATGLRALEATTGVTLIAAPGSSFGWDGPDQKEGIAIATALIAHAERCRDRLAILDGPPPEGQPDPLALRAVLPGSGRAALYAPWIVMSSGERPQPPSGIVCGAILREQRTAGIERAATPYLKRVAGLRPVLDQTAINELSAAGVNPLVELPGGETRIWGGRTLSSDPEWKYVNVARQLVFIERSIDQGLAWAVFEPNDEPLWSRVRAQVEDFLLELWRDGALQGQAPDQAFFVRCDQTTMTQADIGAGRLICQVGVATIRPAEFVVLRIMRRLGPGTI